MVRIRKESVLIGYLLFVAAAWMLIYFVAFGKADKTEITAEATTVSYQAPEVSIIDIEGISEITENSYTVITTMGDTMVLPADRTLVEKCDFPIQPYILVDKDEYITLYQLYYGP